MSLRLVLLGTGEFALPSFQAVMESTHSVAAVYTQPDRSGRGHHHHVNCVKELAVRAGIPVHQPEKVNAPDVLTQLREYRADVFLVAAYGQILRPAFLAIPRLGAYNLHGSLLPRHRGAAPVQYSIWKGDVRTGVTMFRIEPALDSGPIVGMTETTIGPQETSGELMERLAGLAVPLTLNVLNDLEHGTATLAVQDSRQVTLAPRISRDDGVIDWNTPAAAIQCLIRAMQPWPRAQTFLLRPDHPPQRCLILESQCLSSDGSSTGHVNSPGRIEACDGRLLLTTGNGILEILRLQTDGRKPMDARSFLNGQLLPVGSRMGTPVADSPEVPRRQ